MSIRLLFALGLLGFCAGLRAEEYDAAFAAMSEDMANPAKSFAFVKAAVREGDLTGAVAALERILRINPGLANIQLELGVLYLRLGATELAAEHIRDSLRSPDVPVSVRNRAKNLLARADRSSRVHQFSFDLRSSARHDDNANAAPVDREVLVGGNIGLLDEDDTGRSDTSWDVSAVLQYDYAFNSQAGNQFEAVVAGYRRRYQDSEEIDVDSVSLELGPRINFGAVLNPSFSIRPYVSGSRLDLAGDKFLERVGGGLNLRHVGSPTVQTDLYLDYADQDYFDTERRRAADRSGDHWAVRGALSYLIDPTKLVSFGLSAGTRDARVDWEQRDEYGVRVAYSQALLPFGRSPWRMTLSLGYEKLEFDAGDPAIDPGTARDDDRVTASVSLNIPLGRHFGLLLSTSYTDVDSSLPNFEYDNWGGSLGLRLSL